MIILFSVDLLTSAGQVTSNYTHSLRFRLTHDKEDGSHRSMLPAGCSPEGHHPRSDLSRWVG